MAKHYSKKRNLKYVFLALACTASFSLTGLAAACAPTESDVDDEKTTSKEDTQLLKNGNFEFFTVPDQKSGENAPIYLVNTPDSWTHGGTTSYTMSGIIGTSEKAWSDLTDKDLADNLDFNNGLDSSASDYKDKYIDYNGMKSSDLLFKDTYAALNESSIEDWEEYFHITKDGDNYYMGETRVYPKTEGEDDDEKTTFYFDAELTQSVAKEKISNPGTRYNVQKKDDGSYYYVGENDEEHAVYVDDNGDYFLDEDLKQPFSHVLMLHNYATSHNGIAQNYSSVSIDLPANTAAEISVWVKTYGLYFNQGKEVSQDRGASISVSHTIGSSTLDDFAITCINTEKLIGDNTIADENNGWVEYTVYVNSCDFASSTITLKLGLGESDYNVEGYAFFDDITVTKYSSLDAEGCTYDEDTVGDAKWTLIDDVSEKVFKADTYRRNEGEVTDPRNSGDFHYLLDLASQGEYAPVYFNANSTLKVALTADSDNYVSARPATLKTNNIGYELPGNTKLPDALKNLYGGTGIDTSADLVYYVNAGYEFKETDSPYYSNLNTALSGADKLGSNFGDNENSVLVMLSARGAAYTASFDIHVAKESRNIISFWVKTSDMDGNTAATATIKENKNNSVNLTLDTTGIVTKIDDEHDDIYDGWVQCFFFINNEDSDEAGKDLTIELSFGNTTINGTTVTSYRSGWAAFANMQALYDISEEVYNYTGSSEHSASLTIAVEDEKTTSVFDEVYGSQSNQISNGYVNPSNYEGVNGASSSIVNNGKPSQPYDDTNVNPAAGLINKDYAADYKDMDWYKALIGNFGIDVSVNYSDTEAIDNWVTVFGNKSVQPLVITNNVRDGYVWAKEATESNFTNYWIKNDDGDFDKVASDATFDENETYYSFTRVMNYGFIGSEKTVSADSYATVSVKVKVSAGAVAYIYLAETSADKKLLSFGTPDYTFRYDENGNVLKAEPQKDATLAEKKANILYSLRDDGLYEDSEGKLRANVYNYTKIYTDSSVEYFKDGVGVSFDDLVDGETYYTTAECNVIANHYLTTSDGLKLFEYKNGNYYYIVEGKTQTDIVLPFETEYARYTAISEDYMFVLDARYDQNGELLGDGKLGYDASGNEVANKWFTVNFVIHAGSESKTYRLELWNGERESRGVELDGNGDVTSTQSRIGSAIIFDYSYSTISDDTLKAEYENEIIKAYQSNLANEGLLTSIPSSTENINYYEGLAADNNLFRQDAEGYTVVNDLKYKAHYYTYSLYDSANFRPFNKDIALENATGYDYSADDYTETLAYLEIKDDNVYTLFTDYSVIDKSITPDMGSDEEEDEDTDDEDTDQTSVWLLVSSILLVIALIFAMVAILVKDTLKKLRRKQVYGKNNYSRNKANRYIKKLGIKKEEFEEIEGSVDEAQPSEPQTADEPEDTQTEVEAEEITENVETEENENSDGENE